jgi:hypothetical protein
LKTLVEKIGAVLPAAEAYLDGLAEEAIGEATRVAPNPAPLIALVRNTRPLSR